MFKVGDKVKVVKVINGASTKTLHEIGKIERYENDDDYLVKFNKELGGNDNWYFGKEELELVQQKHFTKSDLKDGDIVTYRNGDKRTIVNGKLFDEHGGECNNINSYTEDLKDREEDCRKLDIIEVKRPIKYETVFQREEILDEAEKRYLRDVIRPFREKVSSIIKKNDNGKREYITIEMKDDVDIMFPYFEKNTMYKNVELDKNYTLEELRTVKE